MVKNSKFSGLLAAFILLVLVGGVFTLTLYIPQNTISTNFESYSVLYYNDSSISSGPIHVGLYDGNDEQMEVSPMDSSPSLYIWHNGKSTVCVGFSTDDKTNETTDYVALKIGGHNYAIFRNGKIKELFNDWTVGQTISPFSLMHDGIKYSVGEKYQMGFGIPNPNENKENIGWGGHICMPYTLLNIQAGSPKSFGLYLRVYDGDSPMYYWPGKSYTYSVISSTDYWAPTGWCGDDTYCEDNEFCMLSSDPNGNRCHEVQNANECGYASNHTWNAYECCDDSDCNAQQFCSDHTCAEKLEMNSSDNDSNGTISNDSETESASKCTGTMKNRVVYNPKTNKIAVRVSNIENCAGKDIEIREGDCYGSLVCHFVYGSMGGSCEFNAPKKAGVYSYNICSDLNDDGKNEYKKFYVSIEATSQENSGENNQNVNDTIGNVSTKNNTQENNTQTDGQTNTNETENLTTNNGGLSSASNQTNGQSNTPDTNTYLLGGAALLVILGGAYYLMNKDKKLKPAQKGKPHHKKVK